MNILDFGKRKLAGERISMVTCYDFWSAKILNQSSIDAILVGDSLAMVMHGFDSTVHATIDMMAMHTAAVKRGAPKKFIVGDMPFLSVRKGLNHAMDAVEQLVQAGSDAIKIEGTDGHTDIIEHIVQSGVPVMGHLGLTPQSVGAFGGHRVQGRTEDQAAMILRSAQQLQDAGCFAVVLECIPTELGATLTRELSIPTIGIGAGADTDGQVLVLQDLLGMDNCFKPKFLRHYLDGKHTVCNAVDQFHADVITESIQVLRRLTDEA